MNSMCLIELNGTMTEKCFLGLLLVVLAMMSGLGYWIENSFSSLFYSLSLFGLSVLLTLVWVGDAQHIFPSNPRNKIVLTKLIVSALIQLVAIYYTSIEYPFIGSLTFGISLWGWLDQMPHCSYGNDPAGAAMESAFRSLFQIFGSVLATVIYFFILLYTTKETYMPVYITIIAVCFFYKIIYGYKERTVGKTGRHYEQYMRGLRMKYIREQMQNSKN